MEHLSAAQVRLWRTGVTETVVLVLEGAPDWDRVVTAHEWAATTLPRLTDRVVEPLLRTSAPAWTADSSFELDNHLVKTSIEGGLPELLNFAQGFAATPLDPTKPLWNSVYVEGFNAYVFKVNKALSDSIGGFAALQRLLTGTPTGTGVPRRAAEPQPSFVDDLVNQTRRLPTDLTAFMRASIKTSLETSYRVVTHPLQSAEDGLRFAGSIVGLSTVHKSALWTIRRGVKPRFGVLTCSQRALAATASSVGVDLEDALLATVLGGVSEYHTTYWAGLKSIPVQVNGHLIDAPASGEDPAERMIALHTGITASRGTPDVIADFDGETSPAFLAGVRASRMFHFAPVAPAAVSVTMSTHGGTCCISVNCDGDAVGQPARLIGFLQASFDEILALGAVRK